MSQTQHAPIRPHDDAPEEVANRFTGPIDPIRVSVFYRLGLILVTMGMILLPLAYLALIGLVGYGVYHHAAHNRGLLPDDSAARPFRVLMFVAFHLPHVLGPILVLFMLKPILARRSADEQPLTIVESQEPVLFDLIGRLCDLLGAPMPHRVDVDCKATASAGFRRGLLSMFGSDLLLTVGMPLAAGLNARQFVGVLAHELGHFSQGFGLRLYYLTYRINAWFARVVYERDAWDAWLARRAARVGLGFVVIAHLARLCVWLTRSVLWLLMLIGHALSCVMMRQMEYHADLCQARVAGSDVFGKTLHDVMALDLGRNQAIDQMQQAWKENRLAENLPELIASYARKMDPGPVAALRDRIQNEHNSLIEPHPAVRVRIARVEEQAAQPVFVHDGSAKALFSNFKMVAHAVTLSFYRDVIGLTVSAENLVSAKSMLVEGNERARQQAALDRYFQRCLCAARPLMLGAMKIGVPADSKAAVAKLRKLRAEFERAAGDHAPVYETLHQAEARLNELALTEALLQTRCLQTGGSRPGDAANARQSIDADRIAATARKEEAAKKLMPFDRVMRIRMQTALQLSLAPRIVVTARGDEDIGEEIRGLLAALDSIEDVFPLVRELACEFGCLVALIDKVEEEGAEADPSVQVTLDSVCRTTYSRVMEIRGALSRCAYPFEHARQRVALSEYAVNEMAAGQDPGKLVRVCDEMIDKIHAAHWRCLARLAAIAETAEEAVGLSRLPDLKPGDK